MKSEKKKKSYRRRKRRLIRTAMFALMLLGTILMLQKVDAKGHLSKPISLTDYELYELPITDPEITNDLMLVNRDHIVPDSFEDSGLLSGYPLIPLATSDIKINDDTLTAAKEWFDDAQKKGYDTLYVTSGYRTIERQKELYEEAADKSFVQPPGASEHQTGYAIDISAKEIGIHQLASHSEGKWLMKTAAKYGFLLRYPEDKTDITGISYEPWHFRYVGQPHAYYCDLKNICLEEYIEYLQSVGEYRIEVDGIYYSVYYVRPTDGILKVPAIPDCKISADNTGGYIITIKH